MKPSQFARGLPALALLLVAARAADIPVEPDRLSIGFGQSAIFEEQRAPVVSLEYRSACRWRGLHPWAGVSWATDGATYLCAGLFYSLRLAPALALNVGGAPGYYRRNRGRDLGSTFEFLSFAELSWALPRGRLLSISLAHISNGSISDRNPGSELVRLAWSIPLARALCRHPAAN